MPANLENSAVTTGLEKVSFLFFFYFILLYNTVLVLPYIDMNPPRVYMRSQTWNPPDLPHQNISLGHQKVSFHPNPKECSNYRTIALFSHASKLMLKILQARLQQHVNRELPDIQAGFRKGRETKD